MTESAQKTPVDVLLGDPSKCRRFTDDVAIHWYPTPTAATCWCGELKQVALAPDQVGEPG